MGKLDIGHGVPAGGDTGSVTSPTASPLPKPVRLNPKALEVAAQFRRNAVSPVLLSGIYRFVEFVLLLATGFAIYGFHIGLDTHLSGIYPWVIVLSSVASIGLFEMAGHYRMAVMREPRNYLHKLLLTWVSVFAALAVLGFLFKISADFSRAAFAGWFVCGFLAVVAGRAIASRLIRGWIRSGRLERRAVIVGGGAPAEALIHSLERQKNNDIRICGIFDDRDDVRSPPEVAGYPKLGTVDELIEFARIAQIDMLVVTLPLTAERRVLQLLKKLWVLPVDIRLSAHMSELRFHPRAYSYIGSVPMLDLFDRPINDWDWVAKRAFDILFSMLGIVLFSPVMLLTAIAIKLDSTGPVLFRQKRHGFNNEIIDVYKFRSMYVDQCDPTARNAVTKDDPRVTRVGRFIRRTSIDELPQFFNVLQGTLSLVGPRPHAIAAQSHDRLYDEVVEGYFARHRVKPGVTGWAQIHGWRGEIDSDEKIRKRIEYDLYYIDNWSLWLDLVILFQTPVSLIHTENAY